MDTITIRSATVSDIPLIHALHMRVYHEEGYLPRNSTHTMGAEAPFNDPRYTDTFLACKTNNAGVEEIVGTLSLSEAGPFGFPIFEKDFPEAMQTLLLNEKKLGVLWRFIVIPDCRTNIHASMLLIMEALRAGRRRNIARAICAVNPTKHEQFYRHRFGFCEIDRISNISGLENAPAVLLFANVDEINGHQLPLVTRISRLKQKRSDSSPVYHSV